MMLTFLLVFVPFAGVASLLMTPAVVYAHRQNRSGAWFDLLVHIPAFVVLYWLLTIRFGRPQSLGSVVEFPILGAAAVFLVYLKIFLVDRSTKRRLVTTVASACALVGLAFVLRLIMPTIPE